jgi:hypothetical protein
MNGQAMSWRVVEPKPAPELIPGRLWLFACNGSGTIEIRHGSPYFSQVAGSPWEDEAFMRGGLRQLHEAVCANVGVA